jgi:Uma2 family endonuclease
MKQFHALRDERPEGEKWELIDGVPVMIPPPTLVHQRIAKALLLLLTTHLDEHHLGWQADLEIGVLIPNDAKFNPEPDITAIDEGVQPGQLYAERFYLVEEILSPNDQAKVLKAKLGFYQAHEHCLGVIFVRQDNMSAKVYARAWGWRARILDRAEARIDVPGIGDSGVLGDLYRNTPLAQAKEPKQN